MLLNITKNEWGQQENGRKIMQFLSSGITPFENIRAATEAEG